MTRRNRTQATRLTDIADRQRLIYTALIGPPVVLAIILIFATALRGLLCWS